jgi:hypothetical protein
VNCTLAGLLPKALNRSTRSALFDSEITLGAFVANLETALGILGAAQRSRNPTCRAEQRSAGPNAVRPYSRGKMFAKKTRIYGIAVQCREGPQAKTAIQAALQVTRLIIVRNEIKSARRHNSIFGVSRIRKTV